MVAKQGLLACRLAWRFLTARKGSNAFNTLTLSALIGISIGTAAMIVVLSVFNGFHNLLRDLFGEIDADIKITAQAGRYLPLSTAQQIKTALQSERLIDHASEMIEGRAMLRYRNRQTVVEVRGVDDHYLAVSNIQKTVKNGHFYLQNNDGQPAIVMGIGVAHNINPAFLEWEEPLTLMTVSSTRELASTDPDKLLIQEQFIPAGLFFLQKSYEDRIVYVNLETAQRLFEAGNQISALELKLAQGVTPNQIKTYLKQLPGNLHQTIVVRDRFEQHATLFEVMKSEKAVAYLLITLMIVLTVGNIVGSLVLTVIEKRKEIAMLLVMGAAPRLIRDVFMIQGILIGSVGVLIGLGLGVGLVVLQDNFGFLQLSSAESFMIAAYPVALSGLDILAVSLTVPVLTVLAAVYPAMVAARTPLNQALNYSR